MKTRLQVTLNYDMGVGTAAGRTALSDTDRIILRQEMADVLNNHMNGYTVLRKELKSFFFEGPEEEI